MSLEREARSGKQGIGRKISFWAAVAAFIALFAASAVSSLALTDERGVFYYPGPGGRIYAEIRSIRSSRPESGDSAPRYVSELLLGPENPRLMSLFNPRTRVRSCFESGGTLYVDLSEDALFPDETTCPMRQGAELLERNVLKNRKLRVALFIGGKKAFE